MNVNPFFSALEQVNTAIVVMKTTKHGDEKAIRKLMHLQELFQHLAIGERDEFIADGHDFFRSFAGTNHDRSGGCKSHSARASDDQNCNHICKSLRKNTKVIPNYKSGYSKH